MKHSKIRRIVISTSLLSIFVGGLGTLSHSTVKQALFSNAERFYTKWLPPKTPITPSSLSLEERAAFQTLGDRVSGQVVWSSNREGNHELYLVNTATGLQHRLTNNPHVDFFSRFSPDGTKISFLRSQREWVSFRETEAWDLYLMDSDGTNERLLAKEAYHPTWTPNGAGLVFIRQNRIINYNLVDGVETVLHDGRDPPTSGKVEEPELLDDSLVALTLRNVPEETVGVLDLSDGTYLPMSSSRACQITWVPQTRHLVWIDNGGRGGNHVMHSSLDNPKESVLIDLPNDYSHEYFPRVTKGGEWLIWGAAAEGHEHDRADYEIFAWKLGEPWSTAIRLTFSTANDQWPDLFY